MKNQVFNPDKQIKKEIKGCENFAEALNVIVTVISEKEEDYEDCPISNNEFAKRAGISKAYLNELINGKNKKPSIDTIDKIFFACYEYFTVNDWYHLHKLVNPQYARKRFFDVPKELRK